jgi:hypothetical protein
MSMVFLQFFGFPYLKLALAAFGLQVDPAAPAAQVVAAGVADFSTRIIIDHGRNFSRMPFMTL